MALPIYIHELNQGVRLKLYVQPGASKAQIVGLHGDSLKIKVKSPPEDGRANAELISWLAKLLGVAKSKVEIVRGHTSRHKEVVISDISAMKAVELLAL
ncbi:MAG: DUF167 domain-containing protein [Bdellovibrionales bacterium]